MRHRKKGRKLKRTASHKKATLIALATSLLRHKKIQTTEAKAKETRPFVEKIITRAKNAVAHEAQSGTIDVHARREVYRYIKDRAVIKELFSEIAPKVASRPGGYTRVVKLGQRHGDGAHVAILELVDYNTGTAAKSPAREKQKEEKK
jgi:large subunit ribosomal protein L17